jgi:hypothetical protein
MDSTKGQTLRHPPNLHDIVAAEIATGQERNISGSKNLLHS